MIRVVGTNVVAWGEIDVVGVAVVGEGVFKAETSKSGKGKNPFGAQGKNTLCPSHARCLGVEDTTICQRARGHETIRNTNTAGGRRNRKTSVTPKLSSNSAAFT
jgi:hypothetical protein